MVCALDMANHAEDSNALYDVTPSGDVVLSIRDGMDVKAGSEVTIRYVFALDDRGFPALAIFNYLFEQLW